MPFSEKCMLVNESNIPIPKRISGWNWKKPRGKKIPDLQKYIDSIVKTSRRESKLDISSDSEKCSSRDRLKPESVKMKTKMPDVGRRESQKGLKEIDLNSSLESFLKRLYPNPYDIDQVNEFRNAKKNRSGNSSKLPKTNDTSSTNSDMYITADIEINQNIFQESINTDANCILSLSINDEDDKSLGLYRNKMIPSKTLGAEASTSMFNLSSRQSSADSELDFKRKSLRKLKNKLEDQLDGLRKPTESQQTMGDYDIGKLKLLTASSEEALKTDSSKLAEEETIDLYCKPAFKQADIDDLYQIYDMMDKATESFFVISSRNDLTSDNVQTSESYLKSYKNSDSSLQTRKVQVETVAMKNSDLLSLSEKRIRRTYESDTTSTTEGGSWRSDSLDQLKINQKCVEGELVETSQKIDEVLEFMYNCIMKFSKGGKEPNPPEIPKFETSTTSSSSKISSSTNKMVNTSGEEIHHIRAANSSESETRKPSVKSRTKRRQIPLEYASRSCPTVEKEVRNRIRDDSNLGRNTAQWDPPTQNTETDPLTVERQNELGGCNEETTAVSSGDIRTTKSVLPLSVKSRKSSTDTCQVIKSALETEEKLLAGSSNKKPLRSKARTNDLLLCKPSDAAFSLVRGFKKQNSNFVICVNSLPRNLKNASHPKMSFSSSLSISLKSWDFDKLKRLKVQQQQICFATETPRRALSYEYGFREEIIKITSRSIIAYTAKTILMPMIVRMSKSEQILSLKKSEYSTGRSVKPFERSSVRVISPNIDYTSVKYLDANDYNSKASSREEKPVQTLQEAIEETERKVLQLEKSKPAENIYEVPKSVSSSSSNTIVLEREWTPESEKRRVHDLLMRTYNLQNKLHRYLHKMTCLQTSSLSCPLIYKETYLDLGILRKDKTDPEIFQLGDLNKKEDSLVFWCLQSPEKPAEENNTNCVQKLSQQTSYHTPEEDPEPGTDVDDCSSTYSFKSSRDFSESEDIENKETENGLLKKVISEIDYFRKKLTKKQKVEEKPKQDNRLVEYGSNSKIPSKFLKTVFRGKESLTELSIGLKDVPMTNVNNISVEKKKFSSNHTKISVSISKDKPEVKIQEIPKKQSSFFFETLRPPVNMDFFKMNDDVSKTSETYTTDSDEDDFKSVASTLSNSEQEEKDSETKKASTKTFIKHRFDFYRKMDLDLNFETGRTKQEPITSTMCKYKELEPLQQALTEMQIRMRDIKRHSFYNSSEYYKRALKLAKMSAGYCQSCGNRAVIPEDTFGYYRRMLPRRCSNHSRSCYLHTPSTPHSFYSFRTSNAELGDINLNQSSSLLFNKTTRSAGGMFRSSLNDYPVFGGRHRIDKKYFGS